SLSPARTRLAPLSFPTRRSSDLLLPLMLAATEPLENPLQVRFPPCGLGPENGLPSATEVARKSARTGIHPIHDFFTTCFPQYGLDRKSTRLNSSHLVISYAVFCL